MIYFVYLQDKMEMNEMVMDIGLRDEVVFKITGITCDKCVRLDFH